jgi:hypothetical protein
MHFDASCKVKAPLNRRLYGRKFLKRDHVPPARLFGSQELP